MIGSRLVCMDEMQDCGTAEAFEEADFAILYREINESGTTTLQEITNVPQVFCQEIARQLRGLAQTSVPETETVDDLLERLDDQGLYCKAERIQMIKDAAAEIRRLRGVAQTPAELEDLQKANQILHALIGNRDAQICELQQDLKEAESALGLAQTPAVGPGVIERLVTDAWDDARSQAIEECALVAEGFDAACNSPRMKLFEEAGLVIAVYRRDGEIGAAIRALADTSTDRPCDGCDGHECDAGCQYPGANIEELNARIEKLESEVRMLKQYEMKDNRRR